MSDNKYSVQCQDGSGMDDLGRGELIQIYGSEHHWFEYSLSRARCAPISSQ